MDESFIIVSIISGLFGLIGLQLLSHNWFKKERFKIETYNLKKQNDLQLRKMARDLGLDTKKAPQSANLTSVSSEKPDLLSAILPLAKTLDRDTVLNLVDKYLDNYDESEESGGGVGGVLENLINNPDVQQAFLGGLKGGTQKQEESTSQV